MDKGSEAMKTVTLDLYEYQQMEDKINKLEKQLEISRSETIAKHTIEVTDTEILRNVLNRKDVLVIKVTQESVRRYFMIDDENVIVDVFTER